MRPPRRPRTAHVRASERAQSRLQRSRDNPSRLVTTAVAVHDRRVEYQRLVLAGSQVVEARMDFARATDFVETNEKARLLAGVNSGFRIN